MIQIIQRARIGIRPPIEMLFVVGCDRAELRLLSARRDHELIVEKHRCAAFSLGTALFAIAQQLVDGLGDGIFHLGRLALDHHHWQTVEKKHDVWDDVMLGAENAHLELTDGDEAVIVPVLEINELH